MATATVIAWIIVIGVYFAPSIVAFYKNSPNVVAVLAINMFLGWTGIGWLIALGLCFMLNTQSERMRQHMNYVVIGSVGLGLILLVIFASIGPGYRIYHDATFGFSIAYPSNWTVEEKKDGTAVSFFSPQETAMDTFAENVNVVVQDINSDVTLEKYSSTAADQVKAVFGESMQIQDKGPAILSGRPGAKLVYIGQGDPTDINRIDIEMMHVWTLDGFKAYQVTFIATKDNYEKYLPYAEKMIRSFKIGP